MSDTLKDNIKIVDYMDPFSTQRFTRLIHFRPTLSATDVAALLARYSRSTKSMIDLIDTEFQDKNRGKNLINKVVNEFGDESVAELASTCIGIEGISILAASRLTDQRIGTSFLEKSTRYVPFEADSFYIPGAVYEAGLVDEFKDLCGASYNTFNFLFSELVDIFTEKYDINSCQFFNTLKNKNVRFDDLSLESDILTAKRAYARAVKAKAFDVAGYTWLVSLKTNIGFNSNWRALQELVTKHSNLAELNNLSHELYHMLSPSPFLREVITPPRSNFITYDKNTTSITSVYKNNIMNLLRPEERFHNELHEEEEGNKPVKRNNDLIKNLLSEVGLTTTTGNKIKFRGSDINAISVDSSSFEPWVSLTNVMDEKNVIDTLCSTILYENNENLLEYDHKNVNNIDDNIRIKPIDRNKVKAGILYNMLNCNRNMEEMCENNVVNKLTENTIVFNDLMDYWYFSTIDNDTPIYQNNDSNTEFNLPKDQEFLLRSYVGDRKSRRDKLGRAFEFIDYSFELSSSFRIMREFKRHRLLSPIYPNVLTVRNSYDSFIFPKYIVTNKELFDSYKSLLDKSFEVYSKLVDKCDYVTAQYALPLCTRVNYLARMNARELDYILGLRTTPQAHEEFRFLSQGMYTLVKTVHPSVAKLFTFMDTNDYSLGRLTSEHKREIKINKLVEK